MWVSKKLRKRVREWWSNRVRECGKAISVKLKVQTSGAAAGSASASSAGASASSSSSWRWRWRCFLSFLSFFFFFFFFDDSSSDPPVASHRDRDRDRERVKGNEKLTQHVPSKVRYDNGDEDDDDVKNNNHAHKEDVDDEHKRSIDEPCTRTFSFRSGLGMPPFALFQLSWLHFNLLRVCARDVCQRERDKGVKKQPMHASVCVCVCVCVCVWKYRENNLGV